MVGKGSVFDKGSVFEGLNLAQFHHITKEDAGDWHKKVGCKSDEVVLFRMK